MTIDELTRSTGAWLEGTGPMADIVVSSRVRLARNLANYPFLATATASERTEIYRSLVHEVVNSSVGADSLLVDVDETNELDRQILVERHLISRQQAGAEGSRGVSISPGETRALMINEEDHLRIQSLRSGLQLDALWDEVNEADTILSDKLPFAFDRQFGYLTACPTNVGTGIRVSVMVHLPALRLTKELERMERAARDMRLAVRGLYGEGTEAIGDLYQISNQTTLGRSEDEILSSLGSTVIPKIVEYETAARKALARERSHQLDDKVWRAYGILCNARCISSEETQALLSPIRMAIHMGRFDGITIKTLNEVFLHTQPAHLQKRHGKTLDGEQRSVLRAEYLRTRLAQD